MAHLGEDLQRHRSANNLTQQQMAEIVGVSYRSYQEIERTGEIKKSEVMDHVRKILNGTQNVARENSHQTHFKADSSHDLPNRAIFNLSESNRLIAESNASLAKSNEMLSHKVEIIARESEESSLAAAGNLEAIRLILRQLSLKAKLFHSDAEFDRAYDKSVGESLKKRKVDGTAHSLGKPHKERS